MRAREGRAPGWFVPLLVIAALWMTAWFLLSWISGLGVSCSDDPCQERADRALLLLMGLQVAWVVLAIVAWTRPRWRYWGLVIAAVLPPATALVVTSIFYPPGFSF